MHSMLILHHNFIVPNKIKFHTYYNIANRFLIPKLKKRY